MVICQLASAEAAIERQDNEQQKKKKNMATNPDLAIAA
jgi:hypothetical protein